MRKAGRVVAEMHARIRAAIRPGVTTRQLDAIGREVIAARGARSNFLNYGGGPGAPPYPAVICASPNDVIVHGIPDDTRWRRGPSSPSTAGPSSRATTATPPSPPRWARSTKRRPG